MSTRKGTVVFLDDILEEAKETMHEQMKSNEAKYAQIEDPETTSQIIGTTAVKIQDLMGKRYVKKGDILSPVLMAVSTITTLT
jgi:arginyl-tRNA synthetase